MDFIERIFHMSPDGGNGSLELTIFLVFLLVPIAGMVLRKLRARRPQPNPRRSRDL